MSRVHVGLMIGGAVIIAIVAYLCIPGHVIATLFYNGAPPLFRQTVAWEQSENALQQSNGQILLQQIQNHISVSLISATVAIGICFPLGIVSSRQRHIRTVALNMVAAARGIPGIAIIFLMYPFLGQGELPGIVALTLLAAPPIFLNTVAGYGSVDRAVIESARGMGMSRWQTLLRIESPLAAAIVIAGLRIAMVEIIASATILAYSANFSTLGSQISYALDDPHNQFNGLDELTVGVSLVAGMALLSELVLSLFQRFVAPAQK